MSIKNISEMIWCKFLFFIVLLILNSSSFAQSNELSKNENKAIEALKPSSSEMMKHVRTWMNAPDLMEKNVGKNIFIFIGKMVEAHHLEIVPPPSKGLKQNAYVKSELTFEISEILKNVPADTSLTNIQKVTIDTRFCGEDFEIGRDYLIFMDSYLVPQQGPDGQVSRIKRYNVECRRQWALDRKDELRPAFFYNSERVK